MDNIPTLHVQPSSISLASSNSTYYPGSDQDEIALQRLRHEAEGLSRELSDLSWVTFHFHSRVFPIIQEIQLRLNPEEALRLFQAGKLSDLNQAWYRLVPAEAQDVLGEREVQRQSVMFEIFKSEREYVTDLETIEDAFPHMQSPAVLKDDFRPAYETYIKNYPLSESCHRTELKRNKAYREFMEAISLDPRMRKRDLITFISRPVTRLPRLNLMLEKILELTDKQHEHPDLETLPIILGVLGDLIKSTQPGIEAAESKVKYWELCESLLYRQGEIIVCTSG
ncbi:hypothetical protein C0992_005706 [Termitomyces sp. T32_za158]|nr:hypothetical protein C0992_005706 [Termitomyces sp. T32_za158]